MPTGQKEHAPTAAERQHSAVADMALDSPDLRSTGEIALLPAEFTCDGKGGWSTLRWRGVPAGTAELVLFAMNSQPVNEKLFFDWAVAGIDPGLSEIEAGRLPKGAVEGRNSFGRVGYEICPEGAETYIFALFALPSRLAAERGFEPHALREQVLGASHDVGLMAALYARR